MVEATRPRTLTVEKHAALGAYLAHALSLDAVDVLAAELLTGGAVQENWRLDLRLVGADGQQNRTVVLRTDAAARLSVSLDRGGEFNVVKVAHRAGVRVPEPIVECPDASVIGAPFTVQAFVAGRGQARAITRADGLKDWGPALARDLGAQLARIHAITPTGEAAAALSMLPVPLRNPAVNEVHRLRNLITDAGEPRPALEYILNWLEANAPVARRTGLVHGDFRTGNYLVDEGKLTAILDWEFAHWGDPCEDIGWFCARCWRFGNDTLEAGGIAPRAAFLDGYRTVAEVPGDTAALQYWEIMAAAKWAAIAVLQGDRYRKGGETSLELVLTGLMAPEMELDALLQIETRARSLPE
jgi:aminoglycoside phosphotransferase (APT) family kinase protein